jgi:hypothetical protein
VDSIGTKSPDPDDIDLEFEAMTAELELELDVEQTASVAGPEPTQAPASCVAAAETAAETAPQDLPPRAAMTPDPEWLAPPKPPELVVPPKPERPDDGVVNWWAKVFPHIVWLSVLAGLTGQVFGFAEFFGGTWIAWIIAVVLGGTFEFMMVACSSRGLRAIGLGRTWKEFTPFLLLGTAAAGFAAYMNMNHFSGWLGLAAATVSMLGYSAHVFSHLYDELEHRKALGEWVSEKAEIESEIKARADAERAEYDRYRSQVAEQRTRNLASSAPPQQLADRPLASPPAAKAAAKPAERKRTSRIGGRVSKDEAIRIGVEQNAETPAKLRDALTSAGHKLPASTTTIENWCKVIKAELAALPTNRP